MQSKMAIEDIFNRNSHHNYFQIKIPSHNASKESVENMCHGYILNKLALIPFQEQSKFTQLYKYSLEQLIALPQDNFKNVNFVQSLVQHLCIWQRRMSRFGTWPYTRSAFFTIQQKVKKNQELLEKVIYKRAVLEPNKQEFLNRSLSQTFKTPELIKLRRYYEMQVVEEMKEQKTYNLPSDLLFQDDEECWIQIHQSSDQFEKDDACDYLTQYLVNGLQRFISNKIGKWDSPTIVDALKRRNAVYLKFKGEESSQILQWINCIQNMKKANGQE